MKRIEAIKQIVEGVADELIIATTGMISRELYWVKDRPENFYMCGSMGNAFPIALGLALNTDRKVIILNGDGAALMSLGSMVVGNCLGLKNLRHIILDNSSYASTGGQPTCSEAIDFTKLGSVEVIKVEARNESGTPRIDLDPKLILKRFMAAVRKEQ